MVSNPARTVRMFKALLVNEENGTYTAGVTDLDESLLPEGDLLVKVEYSTLNYKDGMVIKGLGRLVSKYPHIPGVDLVGEVLETNSERFGVGDKVIVTGFRVGEIHWGGFSQLARVRSEWAVRLPENLSGHEAMAIGTAGLSAMFGILALERHGLVPDEREVLITGAVGGVGSVAVATLASLGYRVAASTGRPEESDYLKGLGAATIVAREELSTPGQRPLESERWSGCIDAVGGVTLGRVISQLCRNSSVAAVGLAGGGKFEASVMPFLLRGVNLLGIDSVNAPLELRETAWRRLGSDLPKQLLASMTSEATLEDLPEMAQQILDGQVKGRVVVKI